MAATTYGTVGKYGTDDETSNGLYVASSSISISVQQSTYGDHLGDVKAMALYAQSAEMSLSGVTTSNTTAGQGAIASVLTISAGTQELFGGSDTAVTSFAVTSINLSRSNTDFMTGDVSAIGYPGVTVS